ncbi:MAG: urease accessory protein UreD [Verrucomicrobia bacterium]|nr:urease accessory protein UreD [Verrucomicrobiota bacterium]
MVAPAKTRCAEIGRAELAVKKVSGASAVVSAFATNPFKLLTPRSRGQSVWAYTSSFGGGLVAGDETRLELRVGAVARCFLGTQAATKVYRNPARRACGHTTRATLEENALLVFAPDPVQPFADSRYSQRQEFHLAAGAGLALTDWFTSGRAACGERWKFAHFQSRNEVFVSGARVFVDALRLDSAAGPLSAQHRTGRFNCFATLLLLGPPLRAAAEQLLENISALPVGRAAEMVCSASPAGDGAVLRLAGESVEQIGRELHRHLKPLATLLGDDPWARKW